MAEESSFQQTRQFVQKKLRFIKNIPSATHNRGAGERYVFAILVSVIMTTLQIAVSHSIGTDASYVWAFAGVIISILYGGFGAGVVSIIVSALITGYFFLSPSYTPSNFFRHSYIISFMFEGL